MYFILLYIIIGILTSILLVYFDEKEDEVGAVAIGIFWPIMIPLLLFITFIYCFFVIPVRYVKNRRISN